MPKYLIEIPDETPEAALTQALALLTNSVKWVAVSSDELYDNEWMFTDDESWDIISRSVREIINDIEGVVDEEDQDEDKSAPAWPPHPYEEWTLEQRRALIEMAVTKWSHLGPNGVEHELLERDYRTGLLNKFRKPETKQAIVTATAETLRTINEQESSRVDAYQVFDNDVVMYDDEGYTILQRYAEQRSASPEETPDWDKLPQATRNGLMAMAAESPRWKSQGDLDDYRMEQFEDEHGDIFGSQS